MKGCKSAAAAILVSKKVKSPALVVMGGDSCSKGCGFELQHRILDGHLFPCICCKNCTVFI